MRNPFFYKYFIFSLAFLLPGPAPAGEPSLQEALDACAEQGANATKPALDACMSGQGLVPPAGGGRKDAPTIYVSRAALESALQECQGMVPVNAGGEPDPKAVDICLEVKGFKLPAKEGIAHTVSAPAAPAVAKDKKSNSPSEPPLKTTPVKTGSVKSSHHGGPKR